MAKHTYYFTHDFNSHTDEKILDLRMDLGFEGYGIYWFLIETLASSTGYKLETNYKRIGFSSNIKEETLKQIVEKYSLFIVKDGFFWSESLNQRMNKLDELKLKRAENGRKGGLAKATLKQHSSDTLANSSKGKERKEEERKENDKKELSDQSSFFKDEEKNQELINHETNPKRFPKDLQMVLDYCFIDRKAYTFDAWAFFETFTDNHWCYPKKDEPIKDWKAQARTWISKNFKPINGSHQTLVSEYIQSIRGVVNPELVSKTRIGLINAQRKGTR